MLLRYFLNEFEVVPVVVGMTFVFTFHMHCVSVVKSVLLLLLLLLLLLYYFTFCELPPKYIFYTALRQICQISSQNATLARNTHAQRIDIFTIHAITKFDMPSYRY